MSAQDGLPVQLSAEEREVFQTEMQSLRLMAEFFGLPRQTQGQPQSHEGQLMLDTERLPQAETQLKKPEAIASNRPELSNEERELKVISSFLQKLRGMMSEREEMLFTGKVEHFKRTAESFGLPVQQQQQQQQQQQSQQQAPQSKQEQLTLDMEKLAQAESELRKLEAFASNRPKFEKEARELKVISTFFQGLREMLSTHPSRVPRSGAR